MFGKPAWFKKKTFGWGLTPITWQGWIYTLVWGMVGGLPFAVLQARHSYVEAAIWMIASIAVLIYDVKLIMNGMPVEAEKVTDKAGASTSDVLFIGDDGQAQPLSTPKFDLHLRR